MGSHWRLLRRGACDLTLLLKSVTVATMAKRELREQRHTQGAPWTHTLCYEAMLIIWVKKRWCRDPGCEERYESTQMLDIL